VDYRIKPHIPPLK